MANEPAPSEHSRPPKNAWNPKLYESSHSYVWQLAADVLALLAPRAGERILDLGCGPGQLTSRIAESGATVVGMDASAGMVEQARANYPDLAFRVGDAREFTVDAPFDAVFSNAVLHWVIEAEAAVRRIAAVLRPGGRFVAEFGGKGNIARVLAELRPILAEHGYPLRLPWFFPSIGEYAAILERNGLEVRSAALVDRPTPLNEGENGLRGWIEVFGQPLLAEIPAVERPAVLAELETRLRPTLFRDGAWSIDYRRLRVRAERLGSAMTE